MRIVVTHMGLRLYWVPRLTELARAFARNGGKLIGVEVSGKGTTYDFSPERSGSDNGLQWVRLFREDMRALSSAAISAALLAKLEELRPDVVFAGAIAFVAGATAVRWCRQRRRPVIIMDNARFEDVPRSRLTNYIKRRVYRNVDAVLIPAPSHARSFVAWGIPENRIFYGVNVVDNEWFARQAAAARADRAAVRPRLRLPEHFFLGVGRQIQKKNWPGLVSAYTAYRRRRPEDAWDLVLVGDGPQRPRLEQLVKAEGAAGVHFLPFLGQEDVAACYALAKALVLPSLGETWGNVVNEAMACGLPVLVSNRCGCAEELVRDGRNGWSFSPDKPGELSQLLHRMTDLADAALDRMGQQSRAIISQWPLRRFAEEACAAIRACKDSRRGFYSAGDRALLQLWKGRFRPT